ncbi:MAG: hypothetical protein A2622_04045 [Bdellovibrionales bacterium RIFCSPHIGHO2_01_FULL_40_29]|nr:MAG: hypothetical protein A2622_04045 [Bdellovibrionales bacterium RIFCSPHIGHO2_01_FULL_40_29]OFZ34907.1 MAG: hypothetical protein A3D17_11330 [Bdellovibrionales bacterium RIFCSPHIGHO2_02_FULL_40_15]
MALKIVSGIAFFIALFFGFVATRQGKFNYERSGLIEAPADKIFPYISQFSMGGQWSPYEKIDPNMKKTFSGADGQPGSMMVFEGNSQAGSGQLELIKLIPNELVEIKLTMTKPIRAENLVIYKLTPEGNGTRFSWSMSGDGGFFGKLLNVFIDCENMVAGSFTEGIANLKTLVESQK